MKCRFLLVAALLAVAQSAASASYTIEVCKIPLSETVKVNSKMLALLFHVWVRGTTPQGSTALSFETRDKNPVSIVSGQMVAAQVTNDDFHGDNVICAVVFESEDPDEYVMKWSSIQHVYDETRDIQYQAYGVYGGKNCGIVANEAIEAAQLSFPFQNINGQEDTAKFLYSVGDVVRRGNFDKETFQTIGESAGNILRGVSTNNDEKCLIQ